MFHIDHRLKNEDSDEESTFEYNSDNEEEFTLPFETNKEFLKRIVSSEEEAEKVLKDPELTAKLNAIWPEVDCQTFECSCAAYSMMNILREFKLLDEKACTRSKELEIYRNIWTKPGDKADPIKIFDYLEKQGLALGKIEIESRVKRCLENPVEFVRSSYAKLQQRKCFNASVRRKDDGPIKVNSAHFLLVMMSEKNTSLHIEHGKVEDGLFDVDGNEYESFEDFLKKNELFAGIAFWITPMRVAKTLISARQNDKLLVTTATTETEKEKQPSTQLQLV